MARIARWFLDIELDGGTLRWCSGHRPLTLGGNTYVGLGRRWKTPDALQRSASLKSETIDLDFDSARQTDNSDPIGGLLDQRWRRRPVRLRQLVWDAGEGPDDGDVLDDERGRIRNLADDIKSGDPATLTMEIESGTLAYLERRMETRSPAGQKQVFAGDLGFDLTARLEGVTLPWLVNFKKTKPRSVQLQDEYRPEPRQLALGRFVTSGSFVAAFTNQNNRAWWQTIYAIADHRITSLDRVWINGQLVRSTPLVHGQRTLLRIANDKNEDRCWVTFYDGRVDQTADPYLQAVEPSWTANHRLRGVSYFIAEHRWDSDLPESYDWRVSGTGAPLYDRRKDSTRGGSGAHRWDDPNTWEYSTNAMVAADHYRSGRRIMAGSDAMWFGVGEPVDAVPYAEFAMLADHCDEMVALKTFGSERRYEVNGILTADKSHDKNLELLANQMAARAIAQSGRIAIRPPMVRAPVITLTDRDLERGSATSLQPGAGIDDMLNVIEGRFINPAIDYKKDDVPKVRVEAYIDQDNGEISDTRDLELEISGERAQRIYKLVIEDSRCILELEETYIPRARVIEPGDWFVRECDLRGFPEGKTFQAEKVKKFRRGAVRVTSREVYPSELVWDAETARDLTPPPAFPPIELADMPVPVVAVSAVELASGEELAPGIRLDVTLPADGAFSADRTEMEFGLSNGADPLGIEGPPQVFYFDPRRAVVLISGQFMSLTPYVFRFRHLYGERAGAWSDFQEVTTTASTGAADGVDGNSVAQVSIYRRGTSAPAAPEGGSFDFGTLLLTAPAGWSAGIPPGNEPIYCAVAIITSADAEEGVVGDIEWSVPGLLAQNGTDGANGLTGKSVYTAIVFRRAASPPPAPSGGSFNFGTNTLVPPSGWFLDVPAGSSPIYATRYVFSVAGDTGEVEAGAWSTPFLLAQDGADGLDGAEGADGISTYQISVYRRASSAPSAPTGGAYNFGTQALTVPAGWSASVPGGSEAIWVSQALASVVGVTGVDNTLTWTAPGLLAQNGATGPVGPAGPAGPTGAAGQRGAQLFFASGTAWSDAVANAAVAAAGYARVFGDRVTIHSASPPFSQTRMWNGSVWEVLALVLDGALLVNGSIGGTKLQAGSVAATHIVARTIDATRIAIGGVSVQEIALNAVSVTSAAYTAGSITTPVGVWTTVQTLSLTARGGALVLHGCMSFGLYVDGISSQAMVRIRRGGTTIYQSGPFSGLTFMAMGQTYTQFATAVQDSPGTGARTYTLEVWVEGGSLTNTSAATQRLLTAVELNR